ncbi:hypothetical protein K469DRAFT_211042 [Zopfia rhizophila CBS 207.26]|uniref:Uncharacterized protein n=1 Tax=Zopfia rhizophila CBS 207.26 TaxID=1314779 RepID=A0A6A6DUK7_9PEZI|nr:hypothetical protein K469DRAFT_211042 [Zopfia rhizophila CBS 207.26]
MVATCWTVTVRCVDALDGDGEAVCCDGDGKVDRPDIGDASDGKGANLFEFAPAAISSSTGSMTMGHPKRENGLGMFPPIPRESTTTPGSRIRARSYIYTLNSICSCDSPSCRSIRRRWAECVRRRCLDSSVKATIWGLEIFLFFSIRPLRRRVLFAKGLSLCLFLVVRGAGLDCRDLGFERGGSLGCAAGLVS